MDGGGQGKNIHRLKYSFPSCAHDNYLYLLLLFLFLFSKLAAQNATALPLGHKHTEFSETAMEKLLIFLQF